MMLSAAASVGGASGAVATGFLGPVGPIVEGLLGFLGPTVSGRGNITTNIINKYNVPITRTVDGHVFSGTLADVKSQIAAFQATKGADVSFLSGIGKVFGAVTGVTGIVHDIAGVIHPATTAAGKAATVAIDTTKAAAGAVARGARAHPILAAAGAATAVGAAGMAAGGAMHPAAAAAHVKRVRQALGLHHRRMHVTNTRALHRALRRVKGFERVARRVMSITHHKPVKVHFKFRRHKRAA